MIRVRLGSIYHYGIFVSEDEVVQFGPPPVGARAPDDKIAVCTTDIEDFCLGNIVEIAVLERRERRFSPEETVARARARLGEGGYNLIHNNCEHFAYECALGVSRSTQEEDARKRWNSRPILDVYLSAVPDFVEGTVTYPVRAEELEKTREPSLRAQRTLVWQVLEYALRRSFGLTPETAKLKRDKNGKWGGKNVYISLTHTPKAVAAAVSNAPVGLDIESPRECRRLEAMTARILTEKEAEGFPADDAEAFLEMWTRKECIFKCAGGKTFSPGSIETSEFTVKTLRLASPSELILSVCGGNLSAARLFEYDGHAARLIPSSAQKEVER
jgi:phosphopantetheinyl transferase